MKKNIIYIVVAGIIGSFSLSSCSDWLDVAPKTDLPAKELFETENGFMSALAGLYITMTAEDTYGKNLSFGLVEQLAQMYDKLPDGTTDPKSVYIYDTETSGSFNTKNTLANLWLGQYHIIANANNLLKWLDINGEVVISDSTVRNMIKGEALAIRAYLHFDILRGWGPINYAGNVKGQEMKCMPYRKVADSSKQPLLSAKAIVENVTNDLLEAKRLLSHEKEISLSYHETSDRRFRFNYHAVNATLARVYNYAGNTEKAKKCAVEVIENCGLELQSGNNDDPILSKEVICGLSIHEMSNNLSEYFSGGDKMNTKYYIKQTTRNIIFEMSGDDSEDMRAKGSAFIEDDGLQICVSRKYIDNDDEIIPLIRIPEMYYIACESNEGESAAQYVNEVRNKRGISMSKNVTCNNDDELITALKYEYRKEFYAEGQYFWFLKTHGITGKLEHCQNVELAEENFIFPLPDKEKEYGWTDEGADSDESDKDA